MAEYTGKVNGTLYVLNLDGTPLGSTTSSSLEFSNGYIETTNKGSSAFREGFAGGGTRSCSISFEAFYDQTDTVNMAEVYAHFNARTDVVFQFNPAEIGNLAWTGTGTLTGLSISAPLEDAMTLSGTIESNGAISMITTT